MPDLRYAIAQADALDPTEDEIAASAAIHEHALREFTGWAAAKGARPHVVIALLLANVIAHNPNSATLFRQAVGTLLNCVQSIRKDAGQEPMGGDSTH